MSWWRVHSRARSTRVALESTMVGATAFLVGGSPRLLELDLRLMKLPGVWSMAINNAAVVFEPQVFISTDIASCFNYNIFSNPRVMKMMNYSRHDNEVDGKRVCLYPNTFFFDCSDEKEIIMSEFCSISGPLPVWRQTFFTALAALYQLGFRRVYLLGCTFDTSGGAYAHGKDIKDNQLAANQVNYDDVVEKLKTLIPMIADEGMSVSTCHDGTSLDGVVPYTPFHDAITNVVTEATSIEFNDYKHVSESK